MNTLNSWDSKKLMRS